MIKELDMVYKMMGFEICLKTQYFKVYCKVNRYKNKMKINKIQFQITNNIKTNYLNAHHAHCFKHL